MFFVKRISRIGCFSQARAFLEFFLFTCNHRISHIIIFIVMWLLAYYSSVPDALFLKKMFHVQSITRIR
jgi:hypothetical protein